MVVITSDNPRSEDPQAIIEEIVAGTTNDVEVVPDRAEAIARAVESARDGDVVIVAGKGAEQGQEFADRTIPFDDRDAARATPCARWEPYLILLPVDAARGLAGSRPTPRRSQSASRS